MTDLTARLRLEIEDVHAFIAAWFRGETENSEAEFDARLTARFDEGLVNIQPSGQLLCRDELLAGIHAGYASNPGFQIEISNVVLRARSDELAVVTYVECQRGARNTVPADNRRVSTVIFGGLHNTAPPVWQHIHETGM